VRGTQAGDDIVAPGLLQVPHTRGVVTAEDMRVADLEFGDTHCGFDADLLETGPQQRAGRPGTTDDDMCMELARAGSAVFPMNFDTPCLIGHPEFPQHDLGGTHQRGSIEGRTRGQMEVQERARLHSSRGCEKTRLGNQAGDVSRSGGRSGDIDRAAVLRLAEMCDERTGIAGAAAEFGDPADHRSLLPSFRIAAWTAAR